MAMGGFGKLQKISYVWNTLINGGAALFVYSFVFLELEPHYLCLNTTTGLWHDCETKDYCDAPASDRKVDWNNPESLHNLMT